MEENFSQADRIGFMERKSNLDTIASQFYFFQHGIPKIKLNRPATLNDGILPISKKQASDYAASFDVHKNQFKLLKFVPASGAASRMFMFLSEFLNDYKGDHEAIIEYIHRKNDLNLLLFLKSIDKFPFYEDIVQLVKKLFHDYNDWNVDAKNYAFIKIMLSPQYFDFASQPKGILPFHKYKNHTTTAIEEHLIECINYATTNKKSFVHFTVSEEHQKRFEIIISDFKRKNKSQIDIEVSYSYQNKCTDVLAYNIQNAPLRDEHHNLIFRPAGHGALIENLNQLDADLIFIKNIDNVIQHQSEIIVLYKKALAGILVEYQKRIFEYVKILQKEIISDEEIAVLLTFLNTKLSLKVTQDFSNFSQKSQIDYLFNALNRPIRVCGMVQNEGEPGGGPFWVADKTGNLSLQIIEASQVSHLDKVQRDMLDNATHFNPVDLVCGIKNHEGNKFNLHDFVDNSTGFIVEKTKNGIPFKAFELPGLWNGAMANWITIFVEVPIITFNPVKTVNDLLKTAHQSTNKP